MNGQNYKQAEGNKVKYIKIGSEYKVVNALDEVRILSTIDFITLYSPIAPTVPEEFIYNSEAPRGIRPPHFKPVGEHPMHELGVKIRAQIIQEEESAILRHTSKTPWGTSKHLKPDTIENLVKSNLEHYSNDSLSRLMEGRDDRGQ